MRSGETITGPVIEVVKGGLILDIGLRGFLPASLVDLRRVRDLHPFVGQELEAKIIELDRNRNNVVLSRRAFLEESQSEGRKKFLEGLRRASGARGRVSSIVNFGAFVDLGGVDGLGPRLRAVVEARGPSERGRHGRPGGRGRGARRRPRARARVAVAEGHAGGPLEGVRAAVLRPARSSRARSRSSCRSARSSAWRRASRGWCTSPSSRDEHVDTPESVLSVGDEVRVKVIDVDVLADAVSLSMRQVGDGAWSRGRSPRSRPKSAAGASPQDITTGRPPAETRGDAHRRRGRAPHRRRAGGAARRRSNAERGSLPRSRPVRSGTASVEPEVARRSRSRRPPPEADAGEETAADEESRSSRSSRT